MAITVRELTELSDLKIYGTTAQTSANVLKEIYKRTAKANANLLSGIRERTAKANANLLTEICERTGKVNLNHIEQMQEAISIHHADFDFINTRICLDALAVICESDRQAMNVLLESPQETFGSTSAEVGEWATSLPERQLLQRPLIPHRVERQPDAHDYVENKKFQFAEAEARGEPLVGVCLHPECLFFYVDVLEAMDADEVTAYGRDKNGIPRQLTGRFTVFPLYLVRKEDEDSVEGNGDELIN